VARALEPGRRTCASHAEGRRETGREIISPAPSISIPAPFSSLGDFLKSSASAARAIAACRAACRAAASTAANSRRRLARIGVGQRGKAALTALDREAIVAFCDGDFACGRNA
jgi:hypothetical protein